MRKRHKVGSGLLAVLSCLTIIQPTLALDREEHWTQTIQRAYRQAVQDAADADPNEVEPLMPIVVTNDQLVWQEMNGELHIKLVTWTSWDGYDDSVGQSNTLSRDIWTTPAPQVQQIVQTLQPTPDILSLRLEQLLGLPPEDGKTRWVEMWVKPSDIFRPCPDAEITDATCDLYFPAAATPEHKAWFVGLVLSSYGNPGYPWTRLGYTYDWGGVETEVGANELVVRSGATVVIESVSSNADYFGMPE